MKETYELLKSLGVSHWKTSLAMNVGNWQQEQGQYDLPIDVLYAAYLDLIALHQADGAPMDLMLGGFYYGPRGSKDVVIPLLRFDGTDASLRQILCRSCRINLHIMADGKLLPCIPMTGSAVEAEMPSLLETTIAEALAGSRFFDVIDTKLESVLANNPECAACEHRLRCGGGCHACGMALGDSFYSADPYSCYFFKNGYEQRVRDQVALYQG